MEGWSDLSLAFETTTGDVTQLYPSWCGTGVDPATANAGDQIRRPGPGKLHSLQVKTDGINGGTIELWDVSGFDRGIDVSSAATITNAELVLLIADGVAKKIYEQNFVADGSTPISTGARGFLHGLAARFVGGAGACELNLVVEGGFCFTTQAGDK